MCCECVYVPLLPFHNCLGLLSCYHGRHIPPDNKTSSSHLYLYLLPLYANLCADKQIFIQNSRASCYTTLGTPSLFLHYSFAKGSPQLSDTLMQHRLPPHSSRPTPKTTKCTCFSLCHQLEKWPVFGTPLPTPSFYLHTSFTASSPHLTYTLLHHCLHPHSPRPSP